MFKQLKKWFTKSTVEKQTEPITEPPKPVKPTTYTRKKKIELTEKEKATAVNEPYIAITNIEIDDADVNSGELTFDWNDKFILNLIKSGYKIKDTDTEWDMVNRWYQTLCRNIALEIYEQYAADPKNRERSDIRVVSRKDIGNGRSEIS